jgi:hypothetical protein
LRREQNPPSLLACLSGMSQNQERLVLESERLAIGTLKSPLTPLIPKVFATKESYNYHSPWSQFRELIQLNWAKGETILWPLLLCNSGPCYVLLSHCINPRTDSTAIALHSQEWLQCNPECVESRYYVTAIIFASESTQYSSLWGIGSPEGRKSKVA